MADLERLSIKISADASSATRSIGNLVKALERLNRALNSLDVSSITSFSNAVNDLAHSVDSLNKGTESVRETARAFDELGKSASSVRKAKDATQELSNSATGLSVVSTTIGEVAATSNTLQDAFSRLGSSFASISGSTQRLIGDWDVIETTFREIIEPMELIVSACNSVISAFQRMVSTIGLLSGSNQKLIEESNIFDTTFREIVDPIETAGDAINNYASIEEKAAESSRDLADSMKSVKEEALQDAPAPAISEQEIKNTQRANDAIRVLKAGYESFVGVLKKVASVLGSVGKKILSTTMNFKGVEKAAQKVVSHIPKATELAKKFGKEITRITKMLKLMVTRMALRKVIEEVGNGFKSLALHSEEFNQSVSSMMNGAKKLGYSFAAMVSPLINALAPAIVYVINLLVQLANVFNQVISSIMGATTYNKSKDFAENWADNIKAANKQAKELKKTVLGFDELNQMQDKKTGGGDTSGNIVDMFETEKIDPKWKQFADWLKKMWKLGDFTDLGTMIGKKLRDMLEAIPWNLIRKTANKLGGALATLINGFVEVERLGYDIGTTIAQSVNTVFEFLNGFVHKLHWDSIGEFIADTFNGFFEGIDWRLIYDTVVTGMEGLAKTIQTFIDEFHWDNISTAIISGMKTVVDGVKAFVEGIDWLDLGQKVGDQIAKAFEGINWYDVGTAIGELIQAAVEWVSGMLDTLPSVETLIQKATDLMHGLFDQVDFEQMGRNLGEIMQRVYDFLTGFWDENGDEIKAKVKEFFKGFWDQVDKDDLAKVIGGIIGVALIAGITSAIGKVITTVVLKKVISNAVAGALAEAGVSAAGAGAGAGATASTISEVATATGDLAVGLGVLRDKMSLFGNALFDAGGITAFFDGIKQINKQGEINKLSDDLMQGKISLDEYKEATDEIKWGHIEQTGYTWKKFWGNFFNPFDNVSTGEALGSLFKMLKDNTHTYTGELKQLISEYAQGTLTTTEYNKKLEELENKYKSSTQTIKDSSKQQSDALNGVKVTVESYEQEWAGAQLEVSGAVQTLSKDTSTNMNDIAKSVNDSMTDVNKSFDTVKDAMSEDKWTFEGVIDGLKKTFSSAVDGVKKIWNKFVNDADDEAEIGGNKFKFKLPKFAMGGFPEDGLFLANHNEMIGQFSNGRTAVANNTQIVEGISAGVYNAVSSAMAQYGSGNSGYIANTIVVDGEVIARTVTKAQERQNMRYSPSMG